jgi:hypothetical protein
MEKMKVVGFRDVDFTDDKGRRITGVSLYVNHPEENVSGQMAEKIFLNANTLFDGHYSPVVGQTIGIDYGRKGHIVGISVVDAVK